MFSQEPAFVVLSGIMLDVGFVLMDDEIFGEAFDCSVEFELLASVVVFGRWRKHFDDEERIEQIVLFVA